MRDFLWYSFTPDYIATLISALAVSAYLGRPGVVVCSAPLIKCTDLSLSSFIIYFNLGLLEDGGVTHPIGRETLPLHTL
jgi:hypothetical protein